MNDKPTATDHIKSLHAALENMSSTQEYLSWVQFYSSFHEYSFANTMLIHFANPHATLVKGFRQWMNDHHRYVRKGEKGIAILAPIQVKVDKDLPPDEADYILRFKVVYVFDVTQTEGEELPEPPKAVHLTGDDVPAGALENLCTQVEAQGFSILFEEPRLGNGMTTWGTNIVQVSPNLKPQMKLKTTTHELGHVLLHGPGRESLTLEQDEVEAETVAAIVCAHLGIDSAEYSLGYILQWAAKDPRAVLRSANRAAKAAQQIIDNLSKEPAEIERAA